jgi:hypothetical protein
VIAAGVRHERPSWSARPSPGWSLDRDRTAGLIRRINVRDIGPYPAHIRYEKLHPFMDGNGRSGRAIWALMMRGRDPFSLPFLHRWVLPKP